MPYWLALCCSIPHTCPASVLYRWPNQTSPRNCTSQLYTLVFLFTIIVIHIGSTYNSQLFVNDIYLVYKLILNLLFVRQWALALGLWYILPHTNYTIHVWFQKPRMTHLGALHKSSLNLWIGSTQIPACCIWEWGPKSLPFCVSKWLMSVH